MRVRQIVIVADLVYDETQWDLATVECNLPTFVACALNDPNDQARHEETAPYWVMNPSTYVTIAAFDADRREKLGAFSQDYYRGHVLEVSKDEPRWTVSGYLIAPLLPWQLARNSWVVVTSQGETRELALVRAQVEIDRRFAAGKLPDVHVDGWVVDPDPGKPGGNRCCRQPKLN